MKIYPEDSCINIADLKGRPVFDETLKKTVKERIYSLLTKKAAGFLSEEKQFDFTIDFKDKDREDYRRDLPERPKWATLVKNNGSLDIIANTGKGLKKAGRIDDADKSCTVYARGLMPDEILLDILRLCFHYYLEKRKGVFIHASGVKLNGRGFLFAGPAGAGKSTIAGMLRSAALVSDECIMLRKKKSAYYMHSTPFYYKDTGRKKTARLSGIFLLKKSKKLHLKKIPKPHGLKLLFSNLWLSALDGQVAGRGLKNTLEVINKVPCYGLSFALNSPVETRLGDIC